MNITGNTILITGGGSGIGRALAEAFHALGNRVIVAGRRQQALDEVTRICSGMNSAVLDIEDAAAVRTFAARMVGEHPDLNVVINNAGIMRTEQLTDPAYAPADAEAMVTTNLLGPIRLTAALLPHLMAQPAATVMNVSSGLAFVPMAVTPTYCATKAAIHSYTESLRYQLKSTPVEVLELVPPYVQTDLMGGAADPQAMPLADFVGEVMSLLKNNPGAPEIRVERVETQRTAERKGIYDTFFMQFNDTVTAATLARSKAA